MNLPYLETDAKVIATRIRQPISKGELVGLLLAIGLTCLLSWQHYTGIYSLQFDLGNYLNAIKGVFTHYYYAYWLLPVIRFFSAFSFPIAFLIWNLLNIAGLLFALRVFGGKPLFVLTSFQMFFTIFQGNIVGILTGALAIMWWGIVNKKYHIAGLGLVLVCSKYQLGITLGALLFFMAPISWKDRSKMLVIPIIVFLLSIIIYGNWPIRSLQTILQYPPDARGSISLWRWIGPWALIFLLPPIFMIKEHPKSAFVLFLSAAFLSSPYIQQSDMVSFFVFWPNPIGLFGNIGYPLTMIRLEALKYLFILPLCYYFVSLIYVFRPQIKVLINI